MTFGPIGPLEFNLFPWSNLDGESPRSGVSVADDVRVLVAFRHYEAIILIFGDGPPRGWHFFKGMGEVASVAEGGSQRGNQ